MVKRTPHSIAHRVATACLAGAVLLSAAVHAEPEKKSGRERELAFKLQQLQQEKIKAEREKTEANGKLKEFADKTAELERGQEQAKRSAESASRSLGSARKENEALSVKLKAAEARIAEMSTQLETASATLKQRDTQQRKLESVSATQVETMGRQAKMIDACVDKNQKLQGYSVELMKKFKDGGSKLNSIETFDVAQDYREKVEAEKIVPAKVSP